MIFQPVLVIPLCTDQEICGLGPYPGAATTATTATDAPPTPAATTSPVTIKVGLLQLHPCQTNADCLSIAVQWFHKAKTAGVDVAVLPEMWSVVRHALSRVRLPVAG